MIMNSKKKKKKSQAHHLHTPVTHTWSDNVSTYTKYSNLCIKDTKTLYNAYHFTKDAKGPMNLYILH
jgi:hypothetical protein